MWRLAAAPTAPARDLWAGNRCGTKNGQVIHHVLRPTHRTLFNLRLLGDFYVLEEHVEPPSRSCNDWQYGFDRLSRPTKEIGSKDSRRTFFDNFVGRCGIDGLHFPIKFPYSQLCTRAKRFESMTQSPSTPSAAAFIVLVVSLVQNTSINTIYPLSAFILRVSVLDT